MKQFACGAVVPNCQKHFNAETEQELFAEIAKHAREDHGMDDIPPELIEQVKAHITEG